VAVTSVGFPEYILSGTAATSPNPHDKDRISEHQLNTVHGLRP